MLEIDQQEYTPLRDVVFNTLRQAIIKGDLKPGERLLEIQLADKLGVSRTPVREAIRKLELEGLVTMVPRRGTTVLGITKKHLKDVLEIRSALEELALELACRRITPEQYEELVRLETLLEQNRTAIMHLSFRILMRSFTSRYIRQLTTRGLFSCLQTCVSRCTGSVSNI